MVKIYKNKNAYKGVYKERKKKRDKNVNEDGISKQSITKLQQKIVNEEFFGNNIKKAKITKNEMVNDFLSPKQKIQLARNVKFYSSYSDEELKELLTKNRQDKTGKRTDLLNRCAEGKLLGGLRKCPKCKLGGNLKFNLKKGTFYCNGTADEKCNYKSSFAERNPWLEEI